MTTDGPRWDAIEAALSEPEREVLLLVCRFHHLDPARWYTVAALRSVFCALAINRVADGILSSGVETVPLARLLAGIELGLASESYERLGRRWRKQADKVSVR